MKFLSRIKEYFRLKFIKNKLNKSSNINYKYPSLSKIPPKIKIDKKIINQSEIARRLGISKSYVNMILMGWRRSSKYEKLILDIINQSLGK